MQLLIAGWILGTLILLYSNAHEVTAQPADAPDNKQKIHLTKLDLELIERKAATVGLKNLAFLLTERPYGAPRNRSRLQQKGPRELEVKPEKQCDPTEPLGRDKKLYQDSGSRGVLHCKFQVA